MTNPAEFAEAFRSLYGGQPRIYRAPGRVNLIGEHTDYNEGFVMPAAIDFFTLVAIDTRDDRRIVIRSENFSERAELDLDQTPSRGRGHWSDYPFGVAVKLEAAGQHLRGANMLVRGEVPIGSGLSSSAAIEVATGFALLDIAGTRIDRLELAKVCRQAENEFVGMRCGLMDQFISCFGQTGHALMLDCRSLDYRLLPLPDNMKLVVCNTMVKHELAASEYNARRAECEEGVRLLARELPEVRFLRDVTIGNLEQLGNELPAVVGKRSRHVVSENARVVEAAAALEREDLKTFGELMGESHRSLRDDYEVSCGELDVMVDIANQAEGVFGARMTGGGFGGCTINLVRSESIESFKGVVAKDYAQATGREPEIYVCSSAQGAERVV
ncbi:MAG TPA: galactokinase [Pyrinomonadaceae bacterium]|nr:galactokinase [Pyrinomonadaceae bacterium]